MEYKNLKIILKNYNFWIKLYRQPQFVMFGELWLTLQWNGHFIQSILKLKLKSNNIYCIFQ